MNNANNISNPKNGSGHDQQSVDQIMNLLKQLEQNLRSSESDELSRRLSEIQREAVHAFTRGN
ncbi:hypothetical protein [Aeribacillus composti]